MLRPRIQRSKDCACAQVVTCPQNLPAVWQPQPAGPGGKDLGQVGTGKQTFVSRQSALVFQGLLENHTEPVVGAGRGSRSEFELVLGPKFLC